MAGMSTSGYAAAAAGEGWHYVGDTDEPAFGTGWSNGGSGAPGIAFRYREPGIVDMVGSIVGTEPGEVIFTLPEGYRPTSDLTIPSACVTEAGNSAAALLAVSTAGEVYVYRVVSGSTVNDCEQVPINVSFYLLPPAAP